MPAVHKPPNVEFCYRGLDGLRHGSQQRWLCSPSRASWHSTHGGGGLIPVWPLQGHLQSYMAAHLASQPASQGSR